MNDFIREAKIWVYNHLKQPHNERIPDKYRECKFAVKVSAVGGLYGFQEGTIVKIKVTEGWTTWSRELLIVDWLQCVGSDNHSWHYSHFYPLDDEEYALLTLANL